MKNKISNISYADAVLKSLAQAGVKEICLCAGSRNAPFVEALAAQTDLKVWHFFEERCASFFALGRIRGEGFPVAVVTTSGTAVAELLPAIVEAHYEKLPLVAITADRPFSYRGTGAPQSIEQKDIFGKYVGASVDVEAGEPFVMAMGRGPAHINVGFDEPLITGTQEKFTGIDIRVAALASPEFQKERWEKQIQRFQKPLIVVSDIPKIWLESVVVTLKRWNGPIYLEGASGLLGHPDIRFVKSGERFLNKLDFDSVIRIGEVPTLRLWRDLEIKLAVTPVLNISCNGWSGLSRDVADFSMSSEVLKALGNLQSEWTTEWRSLDEKLWLETKKLLQEFPESEPGFFYALSRLRSEDTRIYLGNSLPIREWDSFSEKNKFSPAAVLGNRGANGIDGQLSTFLGLSQSEGGSLWGVLGDLTVGYDLAAPWIADQLQYKNWKLFIVNNGGGQIFSRLFKKDIYLNSHKIEFSGWAKMMGLNYECITQSSMLANALDRQVLEIQPDAQQTIAFWKKFDDLWT